MSGKRWKIVLYILSAGFMILIARICYLQLIDGNTLASAASAQRMINIGIEKPRGEILDENGIPFTDRSTRHTIILKPSYLKGKSADISRLFQILGLDIQRSLKTLKEPAIFEADDKQAEEIKSLKLEGVSIAHSLKRYDENTIAKHVLGYLNKSDQVGMAGVEKYFNSSLTINSERSVGIVTDARKNLLEGLGYRLINGEHNPEHLSIKLTLDYHIQKIAEDCMNRRNIKGAVVVEDVLTGDIAAMVSKPDYDQNAVERYLSSPNNELFNRATAAYNLGSIFKIIDAVLLYEKGLDPAEKYFCGGSENIGAREFKCSSFSKGGHGLVDLKTAFAQSCNSYFINKGIELGYKDILKRASDLGMGELTGIGSQGIKEASGHLPDSGGYHSNGDIANISIGQGEIMATPLQIADLAATIANGGIKNKINIVDSIVDDKGNKIRNIKIKEGRRVIDKSVADSIKLLMEEVVNTGTGSRIDLEEYGGAAGKTGSAETGKEGVVHAWFVGYFPRTNPRYSIAVFVENGQLGGVAAAPVFNDIALEIMKKGY